MKYHIDTIPVWDAIKADGECMMCTLEKKTELGEAERYLGASVMEPDVRVRVNDRGFCRKHHAMLYGMSNRLGHALMLESHTIETREKLQRSYDEIRKAGKALASATVGDRLNGKARTASDALRKQAQYIGDMAGTCVMCDTIEDNMRRYMHTFFYLYRTDGEFRRMLAEGKGMCVDHLGQMLDAAVTELNPKELGEFVLMLTDCEQKNLDRIQEDISWFIKKFDYRYEKEDWKNSRDAVERTIHKLRGYCVGKEREE